MNIRRTLMFTCTAIGVSMAALPFLAMAEGDVEVTVAPPSPKTEVIPAPRTGYIWAPGYWERENNDYIWVKGHWIETHPGHWAPDHWEQIDSTHWRFHPGHWED